MRAVVRQVSAPPAVGGRSNAIEVEPVNGLGVGWCTANASGRPGTPVVAWILNTALLWSDAWFCESCAVARTSACVDGSLGTDHRYDPVLASPAAIGFQLSPLSGE